ncbi:MEDS domain-containing protein [Falsibacillus pallidus]|uniref:DcmR-like sensory protein n=1 Tax=Falsibacillus pallidus TaxID=493781 RepID=A0A370GWP0_9BACI|nr:MEDS domain-containing protein [Falsibacillus pallidus]RDI47961.1 DcmR-like sensory protein [Falsibacillus pallidus]
MGEFTNQTKEILESSGGHIFYEFQLVDDYIKNTVSYITAGIKHGDHVILIENEHFYPKILCQLKKELTPEEIEKVHYIHNFDFYCFRGDFYYKSIISYFEKYVEPFFEKDIPIRSWAHVEWGDSDQLTYYVGEYEKEVDQTLVSLGLTSVCAYDEKRVPPEFRQTLLSCHRMYMTDHEVFNIKENMKLARVGKVVHPSRK